jgi:hypothetical protein
VSAQTATGEMGIVRSEMMSSVAGRVVGLAAKLGLVAAVCCVALLVAVPAASAGPVWDSETYVTPTELQAGQEGVLVIVSINKGDAATNDLGMMEIDLPAGITIDHQTSESQIDWFCQVPGFPDNVCLSNPGLPPLAQARWVELFVDVAPGLAGTFPVTVTHSGGGVAAPHTETLQVTVDDTPIGFGPKPGTVKAGAFDESGVDYTQAGGHPFSAEASFDFNLKFDNGMFQDGGYIKDAVTDLPAGFVGNAAKMPTCSEAQFTAQTCPAESQVGIIRVFLFGLQNHQLQALYNLEPPGHLPAQFGFHPDSYNIKLNPTVRTDGDFGITVTSANVPEEFVVGRVRLIVWGIPADPAHDHQRCKALNSIAMSCTGTDNRGESYVGDQGLPHSSSAPRVPFLSNPTSCTGPLETIFRFDSWNDPAPIDDFGDPRWASAVAPNPAVMGCELVEFDPAMAIEPGSSQAGHPTGLDVDLDLPQNDDPDGLSTSHLKKTVVTLPEGMTVSPSSADGLQACTRSQIGLTTPVGVTPARFSKQPVGCPDASKLASGTITSPALEDPLAASVYLAEQDLNPFGSMVAMYLVARHSSTTVKLAGRVDLDPNTGRVTATFDDNPQLPVSKVKLDFPDGPRASLTVPVQCGSHEIGWAMDGWSGAAEQDADQFASECPAGVSPGDPLPFGPTFTAGSVDRTGGAFSPFVLRIQRGDRQQELSGIRLDMPKGLVAKLAGVPLCPEAQAAAGTCDQSSRVGTATSGAGPGSNPFYVSGPVYLTGSYKGAPYGLSVAVPAKAGPFDLGTVVVRTALHVDRTDAHVTAVSDPLPRILKGVPLQLRDIRVVVDRPGFTLNPSSCAQKEIAGTISSTQGASSGVSDRFQASGCARLPFKPNLKLRLTGRKQTTTGKHPGIRAQVTQRPGEAAIKRAEVRLPKTLALDPDNAQALCEFSDGTKPDLENHCPKGSIVGRARATTPLLDKPLAGNVYFVKNVRTDPRTGNQIRTLPMIIVALRGQIAINLKGESSVKGPKLVSTFSTVPDAPVSKFNLNIKGGRNGILTVTRTATRRLSICGRQTAESDMDAQNGRAHDRNIRIATPCGKAKKGKAGKAKRRKAATRKSNSSQRR